MTENANLDWNTGPLAAPLIRRSQYLADALKQLQDSSTKIQSGGELGARLLADALMQFNSNRNEKRLTDAQKADLGNEANSTIAGWGGQSPAAAGPGAGMAAAIAPPSVPAPMAPAPPSPPITSSPLAPAAPQPNGLADAIAPPVGRSDGSAPMGIRQNNPGNIRATGIPWQGANGAQGGFQTFDTPVNGIRAAARNLETYGQHGINTVEGIVNRWAPPSENNTGAYVQAVSQALGVDPKAPLNMNDPKVLQGLTSAIIQHENGQNPYSAAIMGQGVASAMGRPAPQQAPQAAMQPPPAPIAPPIPQQAPAPAPQPLQAQAQPPMPSANASQGGGTPPAAINATGAAGGAGGPTPQEIQLYRQWMASGNPQQVAAARQWAVKKQEEMAAGPQYDIQIVNGAPVYIPKQPGNGQVQSIGLPAGSRNQMLPAQQAGFPSAPPGIMAEVTPLGEHKLLDVPEHLQPKTVGHPSTPDELASVHLAPGTAAWTGESGKPEPYSAGNQVIEGGLSEDAKQQLAEGWLVNRTLPAFGFGPKAVKDREDILNIAAQMEKASGKSGADAVVAASAFKANSQALNKITTQESQVQTAQNTMLQNGAIVRSVLKAGAGTGSPVLNMPYQAFRKQFQGNPDVTRLDTALQVYRGEAAKINSGNFGSAGATVEAQKEIKHLLDDNASVGQILGAMDIMDRDAANRTQSYAQQKSTLRGAMNPTTAISSPEAGKVIHYDKAGNRVQ